MTGTKEPGAKWSAQGRKFAIAGLSVTGRAVATALVTAGAHVWGVDARADAAGGELQQLARSGAQFAQLPADIDGAAAREWLVERDIEILIASPGWPPRAPLLRAATALGIPIWSEAELAWRMRVNPRAPWLAVSGTNGKTTTVRMLEAILKSANLQVAAVGNIGQPLITAALNPDLDVLAVELSSFQLQHTYTMAPTASALLNIAEDHLDWHGDFAAYIAAKAQIFENTTIACLYNLADPRTEELLRQADVAAGARAIGVTVGVPPLGSLGVVEGHLYDRGFYEQRRSAAQEIGTLTALQSPGSEAGIPAHVALDALFAAGLALAIDVAPADIAAGLTLFAMSQGSEEHRGERVGLHNQITYINNSKATNAHAARAAFSGLQPSSVVWILGGKTKGAHLDSLIAEVAPYLAGAVVIGEQRGEICQLLTRHAPDLPVIEIDAGQTGHVTNTAELADHIMVEAVRAATKLARPGQTVLLAPACASQDQFASYIQRGTAFTAAVAGLERPKGVG